MTIRDVTYTNDVCKVVLTKPQATTYTGGSYRLSGTPSSLADSAYASPSLDLDFAKTRTVDSRITFARSSVGTYYGSDGLLKTAGVNEPRINFNPETGECLGLLMEQGVQNTIPNSASPLGQFTFNGGVSRTSMVAAIPTGLVDPTGKTLRLRASNTTLNEIKYVLRAETYIGTQVCVFSAFFQRDPGSTSTLFPSLIMDDGSTSGVAGCFDLDNGICNSFTTGSGVARGVGMEKLPNGWWRCWIVGYTVGGPGRAAISLSSTYRTSGNGYNPGYTATSLNDGIYVFGPMIEKNISGITKASSYWETTGTATSRALDSAFITGTNFSSWYNQSEGTILVDFQKTNASTNNTGYPSIYSINDGTGNNQIPLYNTDASNQITNYQVKTNGIVQNENYQYGLSQAGLNRVLQSYTENRLDLVVNGTRYSVVDNIVTVPTVNRMSIGCDLSGFNQLNECISRIVYYPKYLDPQVTVGMTIPRDF